MSNRLSEEKIIEYLNNCGFEPLDISEYKTQQSKLHMRCLKCGNEEYTSFIRKVYDEQVKCKNCKELELINKWKNKFNPSDGDLLEIIHDRCIWYSYKCNICGEVHKTKCSDYVNNNIKRCKVRQIDRITNSSIKSRVNKAKLKFYEKFNEDPRFENYEIVGKYEIKRDKIDILHKTCGGIFSITPDNLLRNYPNIQEYCPCCREITTSGPENYLLKYCQELGFQARKVPRGQILPLELDIYIPELKIAFEYNGNYWHSSKNGIKKNYHKNKSDMFLQKDINIIHLWEYWGLDMCKSIIRAKLGKTIKLQARKCTVQPIDTKVAKEFLEENHFHGYKLSKICLGLYFNNNLVSCMTFSNTDQGCELSRFACNKDYTVVGGFNKLLNYFWKIYKIPEIYTYAYKDLNSDYTKSIYYKNEFEFVHETGPSLYYWDSKSNAIIMRRNLQKKKIKEKYPEVFDESKTEKQMCEELGFYQIYDSGTYKFKKNNPYL